jgi:hypothetical protein
MMNKHSVWNNHKNNSTKTLKKRGDQKGERNMACVQVQCGYYELARNKDKKQFLYNHVTPHRCQYFEVSTSQKDTVYVSLIRWHITIRFWTEFFGDLEIVKKIEFELLFINLPMLYYKYYVFIISEMHYRNLNKFNINFNYSYSLWVKISRSIDNYETIMMYLLRTTPRTQWHQNKITYNI